MKTIVTRSSLTQMLSSDKPDFVAKVVGRALVALFQRQTESEKQDNDAEVWNAVGFSSADARSGSITAKYFLKHGTLLDWQVALWTKPRKDGSPKLVKYVKQLNDIAVRKAASK